MSENFVRNNVTQFGNPVGVTYIDNYENFTVYSRILKRNNPTEFRVIYEYVPHENKYYCDSFNNYLILRYVSSNFMEIRYLVDSILATSFDIFELLQEKLRRLNQLQ